MELTLQFITWAIKEKKIILRNTVFIIADVQR